MTKKQFVELFLLRFDKGFAQKKATEIQEQAMEALLVEIMQDVVVFNQKKLAFQSDEFDYLRNKTTREQIAFRSAYIFETLYFKDNSVLRLFKDNFVSFFAEITNESAKRHFGKILTDILKKELIHFTENEQELLAQTVASWAVAPHTRVVVQIWAFEILALLQEKGKIDAETIGYLLEILTQNSTPAIKCRLKRWNKRL